MKVKYICSHYLVCNNSTKDGKDDGMVCIHSVFHNSENMINGNYCNKQIGCSTNKTCICSTEQKAKEIYIEYRLMNEK